MSKRIVTEELVKKAHIVDAPIAQQHALTVVDRSFEMPSALYATTVALYLGFLAIMFVGFSTPGLIIPMAIFTIFVVGGFGVPADWTQMQPDNPAKPMTMGKFARDGIMTNTGRLNAREATVQMLILPVLIVVWGLAVVTIAALV
ncbi:MAG: hypothetical protein ABJP34_13230 [Erythrobacter sp.]